VQVAALNHATLSRGHSVTTTGQRVIKNPQQNGPNFENPYNAGQAQLLLEQVPVIYNAFTQDKVTIHV
jgi:hypothetical protein